MYPPPPPHENKPSTTYMTLCCLEQKAYSYSPAKADALLDITCYAGSPQCGCLQSTEATFTKSGDWGVYRPPMWHHRGQFSQIVKARIFWKERQVKEIRSGNFPRLQGPRWTRLVKMLVRWISYKMWPLTPDLSLILKFRRERSRAWQLLRVMCPNRSRASQRITFKRSTLLWNMEQVQVLPKLMKLWAVWRVCGCGFHNILVCGSHSVVNFFLLFFLTLPTPVASGSLCGCQTGSRPLSEPCFLSAKIKTQAAM